METSFSRGMFFAAILNGLFFGGSIGLLGYSMYRLLACRINTATEECDAVVHDYGAAAIVAVCVLVVSGAVVFTIVGHYLKETCCKRYFDGEESTPSTAVGHKSESGMV